jgi:hypothetical protein
MGGGGGENCAKMSRSTIENEKEVEEYLPRIRVVKLLLIM